MGFNVNGLIFRKIFIFFRLSRVGYRFGVNRYACDETMTADWICRRLGAVPIKTMP